MGLVVLKSFDTGETKESYMRINQIRGKKIKNENGNILFLIFADVDFWQTKEIYDNSYSSGAVPLQKNHTFSFYGDISSDIYAQSYNFIKNLDDGICGCVWSESTDI